MRQQRGAEQGARLHVVRAGRGVLMRQHGQQRGVSKGARLHVVRAGRGAGHGRQRARAPAGQVAALRRVRARVRVLLDRLGGQQTLKT